MATRSAQHFVEWTKIRMDILWHHASKWLSGWVQTESLKTEASPRISSCWQMKLRAARTRIKSIRPTEVTLIFSWGNLRINFLSRFDNWTWSLNARNLGWNPIFGNRFQPFVIGLICLLHLTWSLNFRFIVNFTVLQVDFSWLLDFRSSTQLIQIASGIFSLPKTILFWLVLRAALNTNKRFSFNFLGSI